MFEQFSLTPHSIACYRQFKTKLLNTQPKSASLFFDDIDAEILQGHIASQKLLQWLMTSIPLEQHVDIAYQACVVSLLMDIRAALAQPLHEPSLPEVISPEKKSSNKLLIAGLIFAVIEGFDVMASILGLIPSLSSLTILFWGAISAVLTMLIYHGIGLLMNAGFLTQPLKILSRLMHLQDETLTQVKSIRKLLQQHLDLHPSAQTLACFEQMNQVLLHEANQVVQKRAKFAEQWESSQWFWLKNLVLFMMFLILFSGGFCTGVTLGSTVALVWELEMVWSSVVIMTAGLIGGIAVSLKASDSLWDATEETVADWLGFDKPLFELALKPASIEREKNKCLMTKKRITDQITFFSSPRGEHHSLLEREGFQYAPK